LRLVAAFVWACSALISASASGGELGCKGWPRALGNTAKQRDSSDGMSLSLLSEARGAKRPRCDEAQEKSDWHVLIAMPDQMLTTVGYFGAAIPEGGEVTTEQWETFVDTHIARRLGSFTLSETVGYWKGCRERTFVLTVIHTKADDVAEDVAMIANLYKTQFKQEAVLINSVSTAPVLV